MSYFESVGLKQSPMPSTLKAAKEEILRLRGQLLREHENWANRFTDLERDRRAVKGQLNQLRNELEQARTGKSPKRKNMPLDNNF